MAAAKKKGRDRLAPWPASVLEGVERVRGVPPLKRRTPNRKGWIDTASETGLRVGDPVVIAIDPAKQQPRWNATPGVVTGFSETGVMIDITFTILGGAGNGSGVHRRFVQRVPAWKVERSAAAAEALGLIADFDAVRASAPTAAIAKSASVLDEALANLPPAVVVAGIDHEGVVQLRHVVVNGLHVLLTHNADGTVHVTVKGDDGARAADLAATLAPEPQRRATTQSNAATSTTNEEKAA